MLIALTGKRQLFFGYIRVTIPVCLKAAKGWQWTTFLKLEPSSSASCLMARQTPCLPYLGVHTVSTKASDSR
ncbi:MAG: hypothetical protein WBW59_15050, partial [Pseudolabrys sp.]